ncbi:zinc finger CCCH domain-containing protein 63-like [Hibiscus syriacus]|uniref:Zinc finger CCCH domain-containing protein 63-like n=1 Tax=Hibiscus syriacus TaxID=106335 RepID=A0A6A2Z3G8_HIBSY|nr:zinc finger CCCH domain-containing protein 63-like [Hibiscus syriacus]
MRLIVVEFRVYGDVNGRMVLNSVQVEARSMENESETGENPVEGTFQRGLNEKIEQTSPGMESIPEGNPADEPYVGQEFESEAAAHAFYNGYATRVGFIIRSNFALRFPKFVAIVSKCVAIVFKFVAIVSKFVVIVSKFVAIVSKFVAIVSKFVAIVSKFVAIVSKFIAIVSKFVAIVSKCVAIVSKFIAIVSKFVAIRADVSNTRITTTTTTTTRRDGTAAVAARESPPCSLSLNKLGFPTSLLSDREQGGLARRRRHRRPSHLVSGRGRGRVGDYRNEVGDYRNEFGDYRNELGDYRNELGDYRNEVGDYRNEVGDYRNELGDYRNELGDYRNELGDYRNELGKSQRELGLSQRKYVNRVAIVEVRVANLETDLRYLRSRCELAIALRFCCLSSGTRRVKCNEGKVLRTRYTIV